MMIRSLVLLFAGILLIHHSGIAQPADGRYYIRISGGRFLEAESNTYKSDGCKIQTWQPGYTLNQLWEIRRVSPGSNRYYILNVGAGKALDADAGTVNNNGCRVQLWQPVSNSLNQQWIFQPVTSGTFTIRNAAAASNKVLNIQGGVLTRGGVAAELYDNSNAEAQKWNLVRSYDSAVVSTNMVDLRLNQTSMKTQAPEGIDRGFCTFFGNLAALEAAYKKRGYGELNLSEEYFSIAAKTNWLHGKWSEITSSNFAENQVGGFQGGGQIALLMKGLKVPLESDVPYKVHPPVTTLPDPITQKMVNEYNASFITPGVTNARQYYGVSGGYVFTFAEMKNKSMYEKMLDLGYEIDADMSFAHNYLVVGYNKTNPANPIFYLKDSYAEPGTRCLSDCITIHCDTLIKYVNGAAIITAVTIPGSFPEVKYLGRWNLVFDGQRGILDINHIPGITQVPLYAADGRTEVTDRRLGTFTAANGNIYRVNGSISNNVLEFYFDIATPNLRWDQLTGRKFNYTISQDGTLMSGSHQDADTRTYGGYASRTSYISHTSLPDDNLLNFRNTRWTLRMSNITGTVVFGSAGTETGINGQFTQAGSTRPVSVQLAKSSVPGTVPLRFTMGSLNANAYFLNHEKGIVCGRELTGQGVFVLYKN